MMIMDSSKPLYLQVEADIKNRILSKQYMPGDKLPTENELSDQYNAVSYTHLDLTANGLIIVDHICY